MALALVAVLGGMVTTPSTAANPTAYYQVDSYVPRSGAGVWECHTRGMYLTAGLYYHAASFRNHFTPENRPTEKWTWNNRVWTTGWYRWTVCLKRNDVHPGYFYVESEIRDTQGRFVMDETVLSPNQGTFSKEWVRWAGKLQLQ